MTTDEHDVTIHRLTPDTPGGEGLWVAVVACCDLTFGPDTIDKVDDEQTTHCMDCEVFASRLAARDQANSR